MLYGLTSYNILLLCAGAQLLLNNIALYTQSSNKSTYSHTKA